MAGGLDRIAVTTAAIGDIPADTDPATSKFWQPTWPPGTERRVLARDDSMQGGATVLLHFPAGYHRPLERAYFEEHGKQRFEYHTMHEEVFIIDGEFQLGPWFGLQGPAYFNHPEKCLHPANHSTEHGVTLLVKNSGPVDFLYEDVPQDWDAIGYTYADAASSPHTPVMPIHLDDHAWQPVLDSDGRPTGREAKTIWRDIERGWTTWLMRLPAGWEGTGNLVEQRGGDEMFLMDGDLVVAPTGDPVHLKGRGYYCEPDRSVFAGHLERSEGGCTAIRWTRNSGLRLPEPIA